MASYTEKQRIELINSICDEMAKGRSLRSILNDKGMPSRPTFRKWRDSSEKIIAQYMRACEDRADFIFDEMFEIADDGTNDFTKREIAEGVEVEQLNSEHIQRSRLRIDTRKWALSKMQPQKYGDKLEIKSKNTNVNIELTEDEKKEHLNEIRKGLSELNDY